MNAEFHYKGPLRKIRFRYSDGERGFLPIIRALARVLLWIFSCQ
jgi:hypothetical protein